MSFDSIINHAEYFSEHYLDALVQADLKDLRSRWDAAEGAGMVTPRKAVRSLGPAFFDAKADAIDDRDALVRMHDAVLGALGFPAARNALAATHGETINVEVPVVHVAVSETGTEVIVIEAAFAADVDDLLGEDGRLLEALDVDGDLVASVSKAVPALFALDEPPSHVLVVAGALVLLGSREKWAEGRFLAVDLDLALGRGDTKVKGELETVAALFSRDALMAIDGEAVIDKLGTASYKHAVGVSADLREGVRRSVEDIANEVVRGRLERKLAVYDKSDIERDLTRESLRFLYRILFLLYAEARPETGVLPTTADGYEDGYGLDRLRELALTELTNEDARAGSHLHDSLDLLFGLVNNGYHHEFVEQQLVPEEVDADDTGLIFEPLQSDLFAPGSTLLIDSVRLRNDVLQRVLARLLMTREKSGRDRQFVSYSTLGINQLGAVYEGLMAYTGFLAGEPLYELRRPGTEEHDGTWVVPVADADEYPDEAFVTIPGEDGRPSARVRHDRGSFVYRLSGRDRQRSASYYTPEVLTRCVVKHALAELLDQGGRVTRADEILDLTVCEPALGSGAFLNEAVNQLAAEYLRRKEAELDEVIDPEKYPGELQKVKAHIALHQCYGVDLNATAIELAAVSLWLNVMHPGLRAPWFGLRLRRGNSLVGARHAVYAIESLRKTRWLKAAPTDRPLHGGPLTENAVHHFLLPAAGWGSAATAKQAREFTPDAAKALADWRKSATVALTPDDVSRLVRLGGRVEALWALAGQRLVLAERDLRRSIELFGSSTPASPVAATRGAVEAALMDQDSALTRLRLVMDAWCALWFWPLTTAEGVSPPTRVQWLDALERLLGVDPRPAHTAGQGQTDLFADFQSLDDRERKLASGIRIEKVADVVVLHPWLAVVREIAAREGFFHWELEFEPVFERGGFDLQVGNPPWVRPEWDEPLTLAELDPWFGLTARPSVNEFRTRRSTLLGNDEALESYLDEVSASVPSVEILGDPSLHPGVAGLHTNLYLLFVELVWRNQGARAVSGLLHPSGAFFDPSGGRFRTAAYSRVRRFWHFNNAAKYFEEIGNTRPYALMVYGAPSEPNFKFVANAQTTATVDDSLVHDGSGPVPGMKTAAGEWDRTPHSRRVIEVDRAVLGMWGRLLGDSSAPDTEARLLLPYTQEDLIVLSLLAAHPRRLGASEYHMSRGIDEKGGKENGLIRWKTGVPDSLGEVILQGPHAHVSLPFYKQPNPGCKNHRDYAPFSLESLPERVIPRTNYERATTKEKFAAAVDHWDGVPSTRFFRCFFSRRVDPLGERTLQPAIIPPGPYHIDVCNTLKCESDRQTAVLVGLWSGLVIDYLVKVSGKDNVRDELVRRFPLPVESPWFPALILRVLRLNCLTRDYELLWHNLFEACFTTDRFTSIDPRLTMLNSATRRWTMETPLRRDVDRRQALVEVDVLGALALGVSVDQLCAIYRTQFPVLRKYEYLMRFDADGRHVPANVVKDYELHGPNARFGQYARPFTTPNREADMRVAFAAFKPRVGGAA